MPNEQNKREEGKKISAVCLIIPTEKIYIYIYKNSRHTKRKLKILNTRLYRISIFSLSLSLSLLLTKHTRILLFFFLLFSLQWNGRSKYQIKHEYRIQSIHLIPHFIFSFLHLLLIIIIAAPLSDTLSNNVVEKNKVCCNDLKWSFNDQV